MAKFAIACPVCGKYAEGKTGFFARKTIQCSCGNVINVKADKLTARQCSHCGNQVVFDQTKGADAVCPVCHTKIDLYSDQKDLNIFSCKQCGIRLSTARSAASYTCPVCDCVNDVQERLMAEKIKKDGLASIIKYEGDNSTFIWKHPIEDFNYGSQLIVHESQEAVFFRDGQALDLFGPGRYTLETQQLPLIEKAYRLPTDTEGTFHSEVYFINKTVQMAIKWGTPERVRFIDPLTGTPLQLGASGEMNIQVSNSRKLLVKLVGTMQGIAWEEGPGLTKSLQASFRPLITSAVKTNLPTVIKDEAIDILEIDERLDTISSRLREAISPGFEEYGLTIPQFYVTNVVLPEEDPNFKRIRELHTITLQTRVYQAEATVKAAKAQSETLYRTAEEQSKAAIEAAHREAELQRQMTETEIAKREAERKVIGATAEAQAQRMAGLTEAEIMRAKGYTQRDVLQAEVQKSYAEGIGNMGPVVSGGGGGGSIVGDMLGLGVGMAAASAIAPQVGGMFQGMQMQPQKGAAPAANTWDCACGQRGITGNFCSNCGTRRPAPAGADAWDCACGQRGITGNFCSNCGAKRPAPAAPDTWDCGCGQKGITGNFCPNCGTKKGE
ncbi:MAG: SPFH domain-containing protein [Clostridiales bacterium]|nr:SPFH domain-containing protein [Clostridiales bacterium]